MEENYVQIRHAYLEEYDAATLVASKAYNHLKSIISPSLWPMFEKSVLDTTNLKDGGELLVALDSLHILGVAVYRAPNSKPNSTIRQNWSSLTVLGVLPEYRKRGIGMKLLNVCLDLARADKAKCFGVFVDPIMSDATSFFQSAGFKQNLYLKVISGSKYLQFRLAL